VTLPILKSFKEHQGVKIHEIDAAQDPDVVHEQITWAVNHGKE